MWGRRAGGAATGRPFCGHPHPACLPSNPPHIPLANCLPCLPSLAAPQVMLNYLVGGIVGLTGVMMAAKFVLDK